METRMRIRRLGPGDERLAAQTFTLMSAVFEEAAADLEASYLNHLLASPMFWAYAALDADVAVGGLTGYVLPMTRSHTSELFIYDLAVHTEHQRSGVATRLVDAARADAASAGLTSVFVPAENEDTHAIAFYTSLGWEPTPTTFFTHTP